MSSVQELNQTFDNMAKDLVCQICDSFPRPGWPKWYKCYKLHYICQDCVEVKKVDKCSCKGKISKKVDSVIETLLRVQTLKFRCTHCALTLTREDFALHEEECTQRLVPCLYAYPFENGKCSKIVKYRDLLKHYESKHAKIIHTENGIEYSPLGKLKKSTISHYYRSANRIEAYGQVFLTSAMTQDGVFYEWVQLLGSPNDAKNYVFSLEYKGSKSTNVFLGEVASVDESFTDIISSGKCSALGFQAFKTQFMIGETSRYTWSFTIKKLENNEATENP